MRTLRDIAISTLAAYVLIGCSDDDSGNNNNGNDGGTGTNPVQPFNTAAISPADNSTFDGPTSLQFTVPAVDDSYTGSLDAVVEATGDNATPSDTGDDSSATLYSQSVSPGQSVTVPLNPEDMFGRSLADGEKLTLDIIVRASNAEEPNSQSARVRLTYEGQANNVKITGCYVFGSQVGSALSINCYADRPATWSVSGGPSGTQINAFGQIGAPNLQDSAIGLQTYTVGASDGQTSDELVFTVPVDEHASYLVLTCGTGPNKELRLPETTVDAFATQCGYGAFNPANKPNSAAELDYIIDFDEACVPGANQSLQQSEKDAQNNYNDGETVEQALASCNPTLAQGRWESDR